MNEPRLAVIGHPNKGKSSLVAALAYDDSVKIGPDPGTTKKCEEFPFRIDGTRVYTLIDTPGFQRARKALHWMQSHETDASEHAEVVRRFVEAEENKKTFPDEVELLRPVTEGSGVLYVVDGSVPYGPQYEAEMEILRWSGAPSMALINLIGDGEYLEDWKRALRQYFGIVRVFDVLTADFARRLELLDVFGTLQTDWKQPLSEAVVVLKADAKRKVHEAARRTSDTIAEMLALQLSHPLSAEGETEKIRASLEKRYQDTLRAKEQSLREAIERIYLQHKINRREEALQGVEAQDLFAEETWNLFGLSKRDIFLLGAISGGVLGSTLDIATAGTSMFLGTLLGGGVGAVASLLSARSIAEFEVLSLPLGRRALTLGPLKNLQFPHIVFNRARVHHSLIANRSHAARDEVLLGEDLLGVVEEISDGQRRELEQGFSRLRNGDIFSGNERLFEITERIFEQDVRGLLE